MLKLQFKENPNRGIWLVGENLRIGSDSESDIVLDGLGVQPLHAEIAINGDELTLKSHTSGSCYVNDLPVDAVCQLKASDELRIGKDRLLVVDPKQLSAKQLDKLATSEITGRVAQAKNQMAQTTGWTLIAKHQKLQDRQFPINGNCTIGRSKEVALSIPYKLLSREHAEFSIIGNELHMQDLGSSNGCFVNGERVTEALLKGGEVVSFSKLAFTVVAPAKKVQVIEADAINKTMVRPAISIDSIAKAKQSNRRRVAREAEVVAQTTVTADSEEVAPVSKWPMVFIAMVGVLILAISAWIFF